MDKEFVPYELAVKLKALGFDEPGWGFYDGKGSTQLYFNHKRDASGDFIPFVKSERLTWFGTPTFSQAFRWFRDEHGISGSIQIEHDAYQWSIFEEGKTSGLASDNWDGTDYEEAELACLTKLIEIVESKSE